MRKAISTCWASLRPIERLVRIATATAPVAIADCSCDFETSEKAFWSSDFGSSAYSWADQTMTYAQITKLTHLWNQHCIGKWRLLQRQKYFWLYIKAVHRRWWNLRAYYLKTRIMSDKAGWIYVNEEKCQNTKEGLNSSNYSPFFCSDFCSFRPLGFSFLFFGK